jgi:5-methylcytosine-specific restriction endonuclease McrA
MSRRSSPAAQQLSDAVAALVQQTVAENDAGVASALRAISHRRDDFERRQGITTATRVHIHHRDSWTCRYCAARTIAPPVLRMLSALYPDDFPYHPNWRAGQYHPAYLLISTSLDHVEPGARGGSWTDPANLVTACWPCNTGKAELTLSEVGWELLPEVSVRSNWGGLSECCEVLWQHAGRPAVYRDWLRALRVAQARPARPGRP